MVKWKAPTKTEISEMQRLYDTGISARAVAKSLGWFHGTVLKYIKIRNPKILTEEEQKRRKVEKVVSWRQRAKKKLVEYKGGKCMGCGYDRCVGALDFHHRDPKKKDFGITGKTIAFERLKKEVDKCDLVCANCHREIEAGMRTI